MVVDPGAHRYVSRAVHAGRLHGVDFLWRAGGGRHAPPAVAPLRAGVPRVGIPVRAAGVCGDVSRHCAEPGGERSARERHRAGAGRGGFPRVRNLGETGSNLGETGSGIV